ncbi:DUF6415 family natural product biosynthesis protein [Streptomyces sp. NPDC059176]|uniref:DUF6415 family natural product biosynthesis protein n=1 Tax=Streptomyces sp. NPDC059176 TaxID=3346758 RepID=UPI0036C407F0
MLNRDAAPNTTAGPALAADPLDFVTMRVTARRVLEMSEPRPQLDELTVAMRGMVHLLVPELSTLVASQPPGDGPARVAQIGMEEAWRRLTTPPGFGPDAAYRQAQKLARSVLSLCDHVENLAGVES